MKKITALMIILALMLFIFAFSPGATVYASEVTTTNQTQETTTSQPATTISISIPAEIEESPIYQDLINNETVQKLATLLGINVGILALILLVAFLATKWLKKNYLNRIATTQAVAKRFDESNKETIELRQTVIKQEKDMAVMSKAFLSLNANLDVVLQGLLLMVNASKSDAVAIHKAGFQSQVANAIALKDSTIQDVASLASKINASALLVANTELLKVKTAGEFLGMAIQQVKDSVGNVG